MAATSAIRTTARAVGLCTMELMTLCIEQAWQSYCTASRRRTMAGSETTHPPARSSARVEIGKTIRAGMAAFARRSLCAPKRIGLDSGVSRRARLGYADRRLVGWQHSKLVFAVAGVGTAVADYRLERCCFSRVIPSGAQSRTSARSPGHGGASRPMRR